LFVKTPLSSDGSGVFQLKREAGKICRSARESAAVACRNAGHGSVVSMAHHALQHLLPVRVIALLCGDDWAHCPQ
jgi:hypothetical protein